MHGVGTQEYDNVDVLSIAWDAAVVMQADLVGFSQMASTLGQQGPKGAEALSSALEQFFGTIIRTVEGTGGLIAGFAGDAVIAIWPGTADQSIALRAAGSAHHTLPKPLQCRISVAIGGAGIDRYTHAGRDEIWLATGPAAELAAKINGDAAPGATVLARVSHTTARAGDAEQARLVPRHDRTPLTRAWGEISGEADAPAFRDVTVLSCDLSGSGLSSDLTAQQVADRLSRIYHHIIPWGGLPVNMVSEEKGMVLHVVFGLPPFGPAGRELRAMRAASAITLDPLLRCPVGVVDGRMFVSPHGTQAIRTVSAMGWPSSLATRLMQASTDAPLVDARTAERAGGNIATELVGPMTIKGWTAPVSVLRINEQFSESEASLTSPVAHWLENPLHPHPLRILSGPRGIGRSQHLRTLCTIAHADGWKVIQPALRPDGSQLAYDGIARVAAEVAASHSRKTTAFTSVETRLLRNLNPLRDVIPAIKNAGDDPLPTGEAQRESLENALHRMIIDTVGTARPTLIALDDAQYLDRSSEAMLERLARDGLRIILAVRTTRGTEHPNPDYVVAPLDLHATERMICELTGAPICEPDTAQDLFKRTGGNPLFLKDLVRDLTISGRLAMAGGALRLPTAEPADPQRRTIAPVTLRELAATRLDSCSPTERHVLSIASVLGAQFSPVILTRLPDAPPPAQIDAALGTLVEQELLIDNQLGLLNFRDDLIREASYDALPFAARRKLHHYLAEVCGPGDLADEARHWAGAEHPERAFSCHEKLAKNASALFAQDEAIAHASQARLLAQKHSLLLHTEQHAELLMTEGSAALEAVELRMAEARLNEALATIGRPQSTNALARAAQVLPALGRQAWHRTRRHVARHNIPYAAMAATAHRNLAEIAYFEGRLGEVLLHTLKSLNIAEQVGLTSEMVAGYSALSIGFETSGIAKLAETYANRARETALAGGDPLDRAFASLVALVLYAGRGDWKQVDPSATEAKRLYAELGSGGRWRQSSATHIHTRMARGQLFDDDEELAQLEAGLDSRVSAQIRVWVKTARIGAALSSGKSVPDEAYHTLIGLAGHPQLNAADALFAYCALALAELLNGDEKSARAHTRQALDLANKHTPAAWHLCTALRWLCCTATLLGDDREIRQARRILHQFGRKMPVAAAAASFHRAFDQRSVSKRTEMLRIAARLAQHNNLVNDAEVFTKFAYAVGQPLPDWLNAS
ncbi:AAA ATPase domain-containing protein [Monaibacterium marinum]|uniref:AAA ATPase domain-containing protein n=1 Tax=Pontivivens marinum TaxID=1690039 RepID=A0A2C9CV97_9RHOB|nr:AAA family ATPase [Monaibacterium marinum]SOH95035.1 AAA ATPase domain-containing protein [Monaibacterium marinum]